MLRDEIDPDDLLAAINNMDEEDLRTFTELMTPHLLDLEGDDFFGAEGINRRLS